MMAVAGFPVMLPTCNPIRNLNQWIQPARPALSACMNSPMRHDFQHKAAFSIIKTGGSFQPLFSTHFIYVDAVPHANPPYSHTHTHTHTRITRKNFTSTP